MVLHPLSPLSSAAADVEVLTVTVSIWYNCPY